LKIATFNINNINKRLDNSVAWLGKTQPDIVCLQELKAEQRVFPADALRALGHRAVWQGERSWNGVAILARDHEPVLTRSSALHRGGRNRFTIASHVDTTALRLDQ
jgi:exodeoxyribonuclease III